MSETTTEFDDINGCEEAVKRLHDYLSKELDADDTRGVAEHLSQCKGCFDKFKFEQLILNRLRGILETVTIPDSLRESVLHLLKR